MADTSNPANPAPKPLDGAGQPEALRLADALDGTATKTWTRAEVSAELRRLHAEVERVREHSDFLLAATREAQHLCSHYIERMQAAEAEVERLLSDCAAVRTFLQSSLDTNSRDIDDWRDDVDNTVRQLRRPTGAEAMSRQACAACPFRAGSAMAYDSDAMEALDEGCEPSCHAVVGLRAVFHDNYPNDATRCRGYDAWMDGLVGYAKPEQEPKP